MIKLLILMFAFFHVQYAIANELTKEDHKVIESYLQEKELETTGGVHDASIEITSVDLNKDGLDDAVVTYTLEGIGGGNNYSTLLAIFEKTDKGLQFSMDEYTGGKFSRFLSFKTFHDGLMIFSSDFCLPYDPLPTRKGEAYYFVDIKGEELIEVNKRL